MISFPADSDVFFHLFSSSLHHAALLVIHSSIFLVFSSCLCTRLILTSSYFCFFIRSNYLLNIPSEAALNNSLQFLQIICVILYARGKTLIILLLSTSSRACIGISYRINIHPMVSKCEMVQLFGFFFCCCRVSTSFLQLIT